MKTRQVQSRVMPGTKEGPLRSALQVLLERPRSAPHASGSFSNLQYAEPRNSDSFALLQVLGDQTDEVVQEFAPRAFRQLVFFGQACGELGERNRNCVCHVIPLDTRINPRCWEEI